MLHPDTAMHAIRILGVDVANSLTKLAVYQATVEELIEAAYLVDERSWEPIFDEDGDHQVVKVMVPPDQRDVLQRILQLIRGMQ